MALPDNHAYRSSKPAWIVLPKPTSSLIINRGGQWSTMRSNARVWWGQGTTALVASAIRAPPSPWGAPQMTCQTSRRSSSALTFTASAGAASAIGGSGSAPPACARADFRRSGSWSSTGKNRSRSSRTAAGTSSTRARLALSAHSWANVRSSASTCLAPPSQSQKTWKDSQLWIQPCAVSLMLPAKASRLPVLSSMTPAFS